ncbi:YKT6 v-SNARE-like protein [Rhinolophus ferrumequinum]|uniref:Synaptobrevin homolog YKT6 n=1 Tax=Rhinolophus ferrumequinum TaxID=59479 RepID=A0A7J7TNU3_RHIFE|nr:YKT6 v-SNARE-like protein [Rhinolophus ferrumequinum]
MKLYSLSVLYKAEHKAVLLKAAYDVSSFSFFQRSSVQEFMTFTSQLIVERSAKGSRASVKEQEYLCHVYVRNDSLSGVVIADSEYPSRVAFTLLEKVLDEFSKQVDRSEWPNGCPASIYYTALDGYLSTYQNPREADPMSKVQAELDETKIILVSPSPGNEGQKGLLPTQHHGVSAGAWREDRRPGVQVRGAGHTLQGLLQNGPETKLVLCGYVTAASTGPTLQSRRHSCQNSSSRHIETRTGARLILHVG